MNNHYTIYPVNKDTSILYAKEIGPMQNFSYILVDTNTRQASVFDPAWEVKSILDFVQHKSLRLNSIILTHTHFDHINGVEEIIHKYPNLPIYIHKNESQYYNITYPNLVLIENKSIIKLGDTTITAIATPGHTFGSTCYKIYNSLITGDSLFIDGCGHCKLAGSNAETLFQSLTRLKQILTDSTIIYPGHNYATLPYDTFGNQKLTNPYLQFNDINKFISYRTK